MEGKVIKIGKEKYRVIREYFSETFSKTYLLLEDMYTKELFACSLDDSGKFQDVTTSKEMEMLEIVFAEGQE